MRPSMDGVSRPSSSTYLPPFIAQVFGAQLPYVDYLIGNEAESEARASANGLPNPKDLPAVAEVLAQ